MTLYYPGGSLGYLQRCRILFCIQASRRKARRYKVLARHSKAKAKAVSVLVLSAKAKADTVEVQGHFLYILALRPRPRLNVTGCSSNLLTKAILLMYEWNWMLFVCYLKHYWMVLSYVSRKLIDEQHLPAVSYNTPWSLTGNSSPPRRVR